MPRVKDITGDLGQLRKKGRVLTTSTETVPTENTPKRPKTRRPPAVERGWVLDVPSTLGAGAVAAFLTMQILFVLWLVTQWL